MELRLCDQRSRASSLCFLLWPAPWRSRNSSFPDRAPLRARNSSIPNPIPTPAQRRLGSPQSLVGLREVRAPRTRSVSESSPSPPGLLTGLGSRPRAAPMGTLRCRAHPILMLPWVRFVFVLLTCPGAHPTCQPASEASAATVRVVITSLLPGRLEDAVGVRQRWVAGEGACEACEA